MADSKNHPCARGAVLVSMLALIFGGALASAPDLARAQAVQSGVVNQIVIHGNERIDPETIRSYLPISVGDSVDPAKIDTAVKALFRTDLFSDVKIDFQGGDLIVQVVENPVINQVLFEGNSSMKDDKLKDEIQVRPLGVFTKAKVQGDVDRIVELYRRSGRISATVTPQIVQLPQRRVDLIFKINEGPKSGIIGISFLGNQKFSSNDLRGVITTKESRWFRIFSSNDNYDPDRIEFDREQLRKYYRNRGYYDFRIISSAAELAPERNGFVVTYAVDEGQRYKFGKLTVVTELKKLNPDILHALLPIKEGQIYQDDKLDQATDALTFAAGAAGFAFVDVRPRFTPDRTKHVVNVTFDVKEGPRVYIDKIQISGNTQTMDYVIRRRLTLSEGDAYNKALVNRSKNNLKALGFFKDVDITNVPGSAPDRTTLQVKVTEQPTGQLSFSAGYSTVEGIITDVGITQTNFRGRGQDLSARISLGSIQQIADISFTEPHFLDRDLSGGFDVFGQRYDFTQYTSYTSTSVGTTARLGIALAPNLALRLNYTIRLDDIIVDDYLCVPGAQLTSIVLCDESGTYLTSSVGYTLGYNHLNDPVQPTRGFYMSLEQDLAGFGGTVHYLKDVARGGFYHGFTKDLIFSLTGSTGYIDGWDGDTIRIGDRFYMGGDTFRGFQIAGIGPRDTQYGDALGGKFYAIGTAELTIPTKLPEQYGIKLALFTDFGTEGLLDKSDKINPFTNLPITTVVDNLGFRQTVGVSIFWKSPMGPLRFNLGEPIFKQRYDQTEFFQFSTATRF